MSAPIDVARLFRCQMHVTVPRMTLPDGSHPGNQRPETRWSMLEGLHGGAAQDAWRWFIERYRTYIRIGLERMIQPRQRAEEATEEIWSYLFESSVIENADRTRRFRTYLAGTVRNFAYAWMRRNSTSEVRHDRDALASPDDPAELVEAQDLRLWKSQVVHLALDQLAQRHSDQAKAVRWFYGLPDTPDTAPSTLQSATEIATQLGIQVNAVHQVLFRGRKRLRTCIENELRETVTNRDDLDEELRIVYEVMEREHPGLDG